MIHSEIQLTLAITRNGDIGTNFTVQFSADGVAVAEETTVEDKVYRNVHNISDGCRQLLKSGGNPSLSSDTLTSISTELFATWLQPFWQQTKKILKENANQPCHITVTSNVSEVLFLPWELLQFPDGTIPSLDDKFGLRRLPNNSIQAARCCPTLPPGPLKVLFMASTPTNSGELDFAAEEKAIRQSLTAIKADIYLEVIDSGTYSELQKAIHQYQPHIVHLVGPTLIKNESGYFGFEDEIGNADIRTASEMAEELFKHSGVQAVIISGRDKSRPSPVAALGAISVKLVELGTPLALGWGESLTTPTGASFIQTLYSNLAYGDTVDQALAKSRRKVLEKCEESGYPGWTLPMLFATTNQCRIFNNSPQAPQVRPMAMAHTLPPLAGLALGPIFNHRQQRRPLQRLLPQMLDGSLQTLLLTGPQGSGKSTLASHLAQNLQREGFTTLAVSGTAETPITTARVLASFDTALSQAKMQDEREILINPRITMEDRLGFIAAVMNRRYQFVLILDGLQWSLDPSSNRFVDPSMAPFFFYMLDQLNGESRFIATSRVTPVSGGPAPLPATCREEKLENADFPSTQHQGLDEKSQQSLLRAALFKMPAPVAGMAAIMGTSEGEAKKLLEFLKRENLAYQDEQDVTEVWHIVRPLPLEVSMLDDETLLTAHKAAGEYLLSHLQSQQIAQFQNSWLDIATQTVEHFLAADNFVKAVEVMEPINTYLEQMGFAWQLEQLNRKLLAKQQHPQPLYKVAVAQLKQNQLNEAQATLNEIVEMTSGKNIKEEALALFDLSTLELQLGGTIENATAKLKAALNINRENEENKGIVACLIQLGMIYAQDDDGSKALEPLDEALEIQRKHGQKEEIAQLLPWVGDIHFRFGDSDIARSLFNESLPLLKEFNDKAMEAQIMHQLATMDLNEGLHKDAITGFMNSLEIKRNIDDKKGCAATFFQLGRLAKDVDNQDSCMRFIGLCHLIDKDIGSPDAEREREIFDEIIETIGLDETVAEDILADIWKDYKLDSGKELINKTFSKLIAEEQLNNKE
ncbi:MAG: CHAT domain-containing protein [Magnetococcales bacterium]|nr:CHAT domain-containing protein [Magnetococcales bacterium]